MVNTMRATDEVWNFRASGEVGAIAGVWATASGQTKQSLTWRQLAKRESALLYLIGRDMIGGS
jgi:hypothetical protein